VATHIAPHNHHHPLANVADQPVVCFCFHILIGIMHVLKLVRVLAMWRDRPDGTTFKRNQSRDRRKLINTGRLIKIFVDFMRKPLVTLLLVEKEQGRDKYYSAEKNLPIWPFYKTFL
jgi:hypothetical protein